MELLCQSEARPVSERKPVRFVKRRKLRASKGQFLRPILYSEIQLRKKQSHRINCRDLLN